jgi:hypothetical protein
MSKTPDFSVIGRLGLKLPPIGLYYDLLKPQEGIPQLDRSIEKSLCEILRHAQETDRPFYFADDNAETCVGKNMVGMSEFPPSALSGQIGERLGMFNAPRCNARLYYSSSACLRTVNYVSSSPGAICRARRTCSCSRGRTSRWRSFCAPRLLHRDELHLRADP